MSIKKDFLLDVEPSKLPFSPELKAWMIKEQFKNLNQLLTYSTNDLLKRPGFGFKYLREIYSFLEENNIPHFLKQS